MATQRVLWIALTITLGVAFFSAGGEESRPVVIYDKENSPPTPKVEELEQRDSIAQYGITWTFDKKAPVGRFVNGDYYVVGPVTITAIDPKPLFGEEVKNPDDREKRYYADKFMRNGFALNLPPKVNQSGFDSRCHRYKPELAAKLPVAMKPGDSLLSSISSENARGNYPIKSYSVLTCLKEPAPADAFRPGYCDRETVIFLARNLKRELLPKLAPTAETPDIRKQAEVFARPWNEANFFEQDQASYQGGGYGRAVCENVARITLLLCLDVKPEEKEPLLISLIQYGLDLYSLVKSGHIGWLAHGGWGSGRKWPIVFAGIMFGDEKMAYLRKNYPNTQFQEDDQTMYDDCWTGAGVVYAGHVGYRRSYVEKENPVGWGPYENTHPSRWRRWIGASYRSNMTSSTWVGQALAIRLLNAEKEWGYDAFLDYCDRWMYEPDPGYGNWGFSTSSPGSKQGNAWVPFFKPMWVAYRENLPKIPGRECPPRPPTGWKKERKLESVAVEVGKGGNLQVKGQPFFPLMVFAEHPKRIPDVLAIGANTVAEGCFENEQAGGWAGRLVNNRTFLDELAKNGLYGVFGADARTVGHPALLGFIHVDAPDRVLDFPPEARGKESFIIPSYRCVSWAAKAEAAKEIEPAQQGKDEALILVIPAYSWMKRVDKTRPSFLTVGETFFKALTDKKELCGEYLKTCEVVGCKVPGTQIGEAVAKLKEFAPGKPVYAWIETKGAKPEDIRTQVRTAVAKGATGIGYRGFEGYGDEKPGAAVLDELKRINTTIAQHAAELLADPAKAEVLLK